MRTFLLFFVLIVSSSSIFAQEYSHQWIEQEIDDSFTNIQFLDVFFLPGDSSNYGWVCGFEGSVLRTTDGGDTWLGVKITGVNQLESISFANKDVGYTSGDDYIFKSTDGGRTWSLVFNGYEQNGLWGNYFIDEINGFVIGGGCDTNNQGYNQYFFKTTDGGNTWHTYKERVPNSGLTDLIVYDPDGLGYAAGSGHIWRTLNGGLTWEIFRVLPHSKWHEELAIDNNSILLPISGPYCIGGYNNGGVMFSTDMGNTWAVKDLGIPCFGTYLKNDSTGWVVGYNESVYYTSDAGQTWELRNCGIRPKSRPTGLHTHLDDIYFVDDTTGWVVGEGIYKYDRFIKNKVEITARGELHCEGDTVSLSANEGWKNYEWSTGDTTRIIKVTRPGDYHLIARNSLCDYNISDTISLKVEDFSERPDINIVEEPLGVHCEGDTVTLAVYEDFDNISWSTGETGKTIQVTESGNYTATIIDPSGCEWKESYSVYISRLPEIEINSDSDTILCEGNFITLSANEGFHRYEWYDENTGNIISTGRVASITDSGTYYAVGYNQEGCSDISESRFIELINDSNRLAMSIEEPDKLDFGITGHQEMECRELSLTNTGQEEFVINNVFIMKNVSFSAPKSKFPVILGPGETKTMLVCYSPREYDIERDTLIINDICKQRIVPLQGEFSPIKVDDVSRCGIPISFSSHDIHHFAVSAMVYPNPADDNITIEPRDFSSKELKVEIINSLGQISYEQSISAAGKSSINLESLSRGSYFIRIIDDLGYLIVPLTIE
ncbi:MAG: YCF48-related protein [Candidatus Kapaibacterium sp.]